MHLSYPFRFLGSCAIVAMVALVGQGNRPTAATTPMQSTVTPTPCAVPPTSTPTSTPVIPNYLALGDSYAFGGNPTLPTCDRNAPNTYFTGYPMFLAADRHFNVADTGCPGETSGHMMSLTAADTGCSNWRTYWPLHVPYSTSQLDYAVSFLQTHPGTQLVTINLGDNDVYMLRGQCNNDPACVNNGLPVVLNTLRANYTTIYNHIRTDGHYQGHLVALTYFIFTNYNSDPFNISIYTQLNQVISDTVQAAGGQAADGYGAFQQASVPYGGSPCTAGLLIIKLDGTCDTHPTAAGHQLLANAIEQVLSAQAATPTATPTATSTPLGTATIPAQSQFLIFVPILAK